MESKRHPAVLQLKLVDLNMSMEFVCTLRMDNIKEDLFKDGSMAKALHELLEGIRHEYEKVVDV